MRIGISRLHRSISKTCRRPHKILPKVPYTLNRNINTTSFPQLQTPNKKSTYRTAQHIRSTPLPYQRLPSTQTILTRRNTNGTPSAPPYVTTRTSDPGSRHVVPLWLSSSDRTLASALPCRRLAISTIWFPVVHCDFVHASVASVVIQGSGSVAGCKARDWVWGGG